MTPHGLYLTTASDGPAGHAPRGGQDLQKHEIPYLLFSGTALGAIRHEGFIPWDDDLDVIMLRCDYRRFLQVAPGELGERYFLQAEFSEHWPMFFSKLRKNNTACMERFVPRDPLMHQASAWTFFPAIICRMHR